MLKCEIASDMLGVLSKIIQLSRAKPPNPHQGLYSWFRVEVPPHVSPSFLHQLLPCTRRLSLVLYTCMDTLQKTTVAHLLSSAVINHRNRKLHNAVFKYITHMFFQL